MVGGNCSAWFLVLALKFLLWRVVGEHCNRGEGWFLLLEELLNPLWGRKVSRNCTVANKRVASRCWEHVFHWEWEIAVRTREQAADPRERLKELSSMLEELDYFISFGWLIFFLVRVQSESTCLKQDHFLWTINSPWNCCYKSFLMPFAVTTKIKYLSPSAHLMSVKEHLK